MSDTVKLILEGKEIELPVITGSENEKAIDISTLRATTGYITIDPGFKNTGSTQSSITYLDGENGILRYRGYSIEDLAENATFLEVAYLLVYGELPNSDELAINYITWRGDYKSKHYCFWWADSMCTDDGVYLGKHY